MTAIITKYIEKALELGQRNEGHDVWWRGESIFGRKLTAGIYRGYPIGAEFNFAKRFKVKAVAKIPNPPPFENDAEWLFLMQHYGLPTRILDWSESLLVGIYFAVNKMEKHDQDGVLYCLFPAKLNQIEHNALAHYLPHDVPIKQLVSEAFNPSGRAFDKIAAVMPAYYDKRQAGQHSGFTIHANGKPLNADGYRGACLFEIKIEKEDKKKILKELQILGINKASMFHDLESLAHDIKTLEFIPDGLPPQLGNRTASQM